MEQPEIHLHIHSEPDPRVDEILQRVKSLQRTESHVMADLSAISAAVAANASVSQSAVVLIQQIADALRAAATDPAAVQALADQLTASSTELGAAVAANTPAAEEPPPEPV